jgi:ATP-dependent Lon protease
MEVIELPGYTEEEKLRIARDHLVDRQVANHGLTSEHIVFTDEALGAIIRGYTREAGVRNLEREIGAICRKVARARAEGSTELVTVTPSVVEQMLGAPRHIDEELADRTREPGVAIGLAWTPVGGDVLFVEASRMTGASQLTLTGQLGDVMKESARIALSWFRANARNYGVDPGFYKDSEIHLHVPQGAIPKDGPSAGITMVTALASALSGRPVRGNVAMTGEITLSGRVLPVGGIKEKVLAARRYGIRELILPKQNEKNVNEDLTEELRRTLAVHYVEEMDQVLRLALMEQPSGAHGSTPVGQASRLSIA